jgi:hypothetical protein
MNLTLHETVCRRRHRIGMNAEPYVRVTVSDDLLSRLRHTAQETSIPLSWLIAGLVCDTFQTAIERSEDRRVALTGN